MYGELYLYRKAVGPVIPLICKNLIKCPTFWKASDTFLIDHTYIFDITVLQFLVIVQANTVHPDSTMSAISSH